MKELLLVGVGLMGRPYVEAARRLGLGVSAVETEAKAEATAPLVDRLFVTAGDTDEAWAATAYAAVGDGAVDGVIAFSEPQVLAAALVQETLGRPGPSLHAAVLSRNKALQRGRFAARGLRQPEYLVTRSLASSREWARTRLPVVVKPLSLAGSEGVELVADLAAYDAVARRRCHETPLLIEVAVEGEEYSWEGLVDDGVIRFGNITAKHTSGPPNFVELCHRAAADLPPEERRQVAALARGVVAALGVRTGLVHLEFRLPPEGPTIIEVAVRTPGDFIMDTLGLTYGFDWFEMAVRLAVGLPLPALSADPVCYAASLFITAPPGVVVATGGLAEVRALPGVVAADIEVAPGDVVLPTTSSAERVGWALVKGASRWGLEEAMATVRSTLVVDTATATAALAGAGRRP